MDGTPFGRNRLIELLGRGGMGEIWRVHDTATDRIVAIKLLPADFSDNAGVSAPCVSTQSCLGTVIETPERA